MHLFLLPIQTSCPTVLGLDVHVVTGAAFIAAVITGICLLPKLMRNNTPATYGAILCAYVGYASAIIYAAL